MAISKNNSMVAGLSGMSGGMVFRQLRNKTVVSPRPGRPRVESKIQKDNRELFRRAAHYAKHAMLNAEQKDHFKKMAADLDLPNGYTAALSFHLRKLKGIEPKVPVKHAAQQARQEATVVSADSTLEVGTSTAAKSPCIISCYVTASPWVMSCSADQNLPKV